MVAGIGTLDLLKAVNEAALSPQTKTNYKNACSALVSKANDGNDGNDSKAITINQILMNPDTYIPLFKKWYPKSTSFKVHLSIILGLFRYNKQLKGNKYESIKLKWSTVFKAADAEVTARYETNKPTERQEAGYVEYTKIVSARDELPQGSIKRVLLGMYTHIRPMRCEYARMAIYKTGAPSSGGENDIEPNYIVLKTGRMIIRAFKTSKHHDSYDIKLPDALMDDIKRSLDAKPRDWLFVNTSGQPYNQMGYTAWTMRVFKSIFKKPLTVSLIRHSFINTLDFNRLSIKEQKEIALSMGHTHEMQGQYRLFFDNKGDCEGNCEPKPT